MKNFTRDMFLRDHLDIKSPDLFNWDMFPVSSILKKELRADEAEREIINGYANAVNSLLKEIHNQNHPTPNELIITSNSLIIPFVFLCRHTIELIIKYLRRQLNLPSQNKHKLINLWNDVEKAILKESASYPFTKTFSKNARIYLSVLEELDPDGSHARYSKSPTGILYYETPKAINAMAINDVLQRAFLPLIQKDYGG